MKHPHLIAVFFLLSISSALVVGQTHHTDFVADMKSAIELMDNAQGLEDMNEATKHFEKLAGKYAGEWLPSYYAALCQITSCHMIREFDDKNAQLDKAQANVVKAKAAAPNEAEVHVIQAYVYLSRTQSTLSKVDKYRPLFEKAIDNALALDEENPRAHFLMGQHIYYKTASKDGGFQTACPLFKKAVKYYQAEAKTADGIAPNWGAKYAERYAARCK